MKYNRCFRLLAERHQRMPRIYGRMLVSKSAAQATIAMIRSIRAFFSCFALLVDAIPNTSIQIIVHYSIKRTSCEGKTKTSRGFSDRISDRNAMLSHYVSESREVHSSLCDVSVHFFL